MQSNVASRNVKPFDASGSFEQLVLQSHPAQYFELEDTGCCTAANIGSSGATGTYTSSSVTYSLAGPLQGETSTAIGLPGSTSTTATSMGVSLPSPSISGAFTVEDWVFPVFTPTNTSVNAYYTIWGYNGSHRLLITNQSGLQGQLLTQFGGINFKSINALTANAWNQVVFVYDGKNESFYINGVLDSSQAVTGVSLPTAYWIGQYDASAYYKFNGRMGQHMVFQGALSASVIQNHYTAGTPGGRATPTPTPIPTATPVPTPTPIQNGSFEPLVLQSHPAQYFELEDTGCCTAASMGSSGVTGTYTSSNVTYSLGGPLQGETSTAIGLPGNTSTAATSMGVSLPSPSISGAFTVEDWVFPVFTATNNSVNAYYTIWGYNGSHRLLVTNQSAVRGQLLTQFAGINFKSTNVLTANAWNQVVFVFDGKNESFYINGVFDSSQAVSSVSLSTAYWIGQYDASAYYKFDGRMGQHMVFQGALSASVIQNHYTAGTAAGVATPTPSPTPVPTPPPPPPTPTAAPTPTPSGPQTDWLSFGYDLQRSGYNPNETTIGAGNVGALAQVWVFNVGSAPVHEPVYASGVNVNGVSTNILYAGSLWGSTMYAINAATSAIVWQDTVPFATFSCSGSHSQFSIGETPAIDRGTNRLYFADGLNQIHAVDLATGVEANGWPISIADYTPDHNFMHGGLTYNPSNGLLYAVTGSTCDISPWYGRIVAINTNGPSVAGTFFTMSGTSSQGASGGGIWGPGGGTIVPTNNNVVVAVGNADTTSGSPQNSGFAEQIIELSPTLSTIVGNNYPTNIPAIQGQNDLDFGATPLVFQPPGCPLMVAAENKSGMFEVYDESTISSGPIQYIAMSVPTDNASFIGEPAYDSATNLVYVGMPSTSGIYQPGLAAFSIASNCTLNTTPAWSANFGPDGPRRSPISIANGVVYIANYTGDTLYAFNATTGAQLWSAALSSYGGVGTVIANGMVYLGAGDGTITAYAPAAQAQVLKKRVHKSSRSFVPVHHGKPRTTFSWELWP